MLLVEIAVLIGFTQCCEIIGKLEALGQRLSLNSTLVEVGIMADHRQSKVGCAFSILSFWRESFFP